MKKNKLVIPKYDTEHRYFQLMGYVVEDIRCGMKWWVRIQ